MFIVSSIIVESKESDEAPYRAEARMQWDFQKIYESIRGVFRENARKNSRWRESSR